MQGEYRWPEHLVSLLDEMVLHSVPAEQILAVGDAFRDAAYNTVYVGTGVPSEPVGEVLALEAIAEGEANRDTAKLIDAPHCPTRRMAAVRSLSWHGTMIERAKRVLLRDLSGAR
jgi:hypothetical protein